MDPAVEIGPQRIAGGTGPSILRAGKGDCPETGRAFRPDKPHVPRRSQANDVGSDHQIIRTHSGKKS